MLTTADLAKRFNVHRATIFRWREAGILPAPLQLGRSTVRWREADVEAFEVWMQCRSQVEQAGGDPNTVPQPEYSLPLSTDPYSMARERLAATFDPPSTMRSRIEQLGDELAIMASYAAVLASKSPPGQLDEASLQRLRDNLPDDAKSILLDELPPANAARLQEILGV